MPDSNVHEFRTVCHPSFCLNLSATHCWTSCRPMSRNRQSRQYGSRCLASTVLYPCCVESLRVGRTSVFHCSSANVPNSMDDSGLTVPWLTARSSSSNRTCASLLVGRSATEPSTTERRVRPTFPSSHNTSSLQRATHTFRRLPRLNTQPV